MIRILTKSEIEENFLNLLTGAGTKTNDIMLKTAHPSSSVYATSYRKP